MADNIEHDEEAADQAWKGITPHYLDGWRTHEQKKPLLVSANDEHKRGWQDRDKQYPHS